MCIRDRDYDVACGISSGLELKEITAQTLKENIGSYQILDVRTLAEYEQFNLEGLHIPLDQLHENLDKINRELPVVVCCQSGIRSKKAIEIISNQRSDIQLINLKGGLAAY